MSEQQLQAVRDLYDSNRVFRKVAQQVDRLDLALEAAGLLFNGQIGLLAFARWGSI